MLRFVKIHIYKHFLLHFTNRLLLKTTYGQLKQKSPFGTQTNPILATTLEGIGNFCLSSTSMWYPQWLAKTNEFVEHFGELWKICGEFWGIVGNELCGIMENFPQRLCNNWQQIPTANAISYSTSAYDRGFHEPCVFPSQVEQLFYVQSSTFPSLFIRNKNSSIALLNLNIAYISLEVILP
jgi:hypothetical protein